MPDPLAWQDDALCAQVGGDEWFPEQGGSTLQAKKICGRCTVTAECLAAALARPDYEDRDGVFGGKSVRERRAIRKAAS
jgi:WhiB family transcriptional regulator, redox-sensing transcriptional regulator